MHLRIDNLNKDYKLSQVESDKKLIHRILALTELLRLIDGSKPKDWMYKKIAHQFKVSDRSLYRWAKNYSKLGLFGITSRKNRGRKKSVITGWAAKYIKLMRDDYNWGAEVIAAHLREDYGIKFTQYKVHQFLKDREYIHRKKRKINIKKHFKTVVIAHPGEHTQLDVKHLPRLLRNKKKCYVYNFIDHASKWTFKMAFEGCGVWETYRFMEALLAHCPFKIMRLQTDHGIEFTYKFMPHLQDGTVHPLEHFCKINQINKKLIPVGEKEVNGLVERSHRQDDNELYDTIKPINIFHFNQILQKHTKWLNKSRRRKPIMWKTANQWLLDYEESKKQNMIIETQITSSAA